MGNLTENVFRHPASALPTCFSPAKGDYEQRRWAERLEADNRAFPWRMRTMRHANAGAADIARFLDARRKPTQQCPKCGAPNGSFATACSACKAPLESADFSQNREPASTRITIVAINEDGTDGGAYPLEYAESAIGRAADISFPDDHFLTPRHSVLRIRQGHLFVEDLNSLNGTYIKLQTPVRLTDGDMFLMGRQVLRFSSTIAFGNSHVSDSDGTRYMGSPSPTGTHKLEQIGVGGFVLDVYSIAREGAAIGRERGDIIFPRDKFMSSRHARIGPVRNGNGLAIEDLGSSNGTWVRILRPTRLNHGDFLFLGQQLFRVMHM